VTPSANNQAGGNQVQDFLGQKRRMTKVNVRYKFGADFCGVMSHPGVAI
jgi:hypothetical protein